ncbi:hypothetical protein QBC34DRAFT_386340 [Podospora aff. communis PSN243]|uniref:SnoaL-like domain-containing protein n=1 Tax=Podospora aff. communis PSN243 TaxID=3040156 RepID=A0AAV9G773_9PEZI|nr:hypothetical protein QBC34DRAFT_386340 [Podospora aff. communis PSN243]
MTTPFYKRGTFDATTRSISALAFIEKYCDKVDSLDLSGNFHDYYAPSCKFYNTNGVVYDGGAKIWTWMRGLFGSFDLCAHEHNSFRVVPATAEEWDPAAGAQWVFIDTTTLFQFKSENGEAREVIKVPRFLMFLVGKSEVEGQGVQGLQILEARIWWDTGLLGAKKG